MATIIQILRTTTANLPSTLEQGELAYLYDTSSTDTDAGGNGGRLYIGDPTANTNTPIKIGGKYYTDMMDHVQGTLTASAAVLVDADKKIDVWNVDNLTLNGNSLTSTDTNGNINITPNGTGKSIVSNMYVDATTSLAEYIQDQTGGQITAGEGIDVTYDDAAGTVTIDGEDATDTNKGIASFSSSDFAVTSGAVAIKTGGVSNDQLAGSIANAKLTNSTISVAADAGTTNAVDLGDTLTISGGTGLTSTVSGDSVSIALDNTTVTAGSYGSSTAIPTFTVDAQGRLTAAGTASITTTLTVAADSGTGDGVALADDTLTFTGGEGIDTSISGDTVTISAEVATSSNKGVATFNTADFTVTSGDVTIKTGGVSNDQLAGSITNAKLVNSSVTIGSDSLSLGGTITDINGLTSLDVDNLTIDGNSITSTNTDGDINLTPNGEGSVIVPSDYTSRANWGSQSLVPKSYVDQVASGLDVKESVRVATTANLSATYNNANGTLTATANGAIAIDGVTLNVNDRVLVKDQTDATQNGFYKVTNTGGASAAFVLTRTPDANEASEITGGAFTFVEEGTNNADNGYVATHNGTPTLGTDDITFEQFSGAGQIDAGNGLSKTGNTIDVNVDNSSIEISGDSLQVKALGITNAMLAGSIANAKLTNSSVTINTHALSLGGSLTLDTGDFAENGNLWYTDERVDDRINALFVAGEGIDFTYDDASGTFTVDAELATSTNKGVASFVSSNFTVTAGSVAITGIDGGTY